MSMYAVVAKSEAEYRRARITADFDRHRARPTTAGGITLRRHPRRVGGHGHRISRRRGQPRVATG
jgi:hypothetical protein